MRRPVAKRYLKGSFVFDVLGTFPFNIVVMAVNPENPYGDTLTGGIEPGRANRMLRLMRMAKLFKLARMRKLGGLAGARWRRLVLWIALARGTDKLAVATESAEDVAMPKVWHKHYPVSAIGVDGFLEQEALARERANEEAAAYLTLLAEQRAAEKRAAEQRAIYAKLRAEREAKGVEGKGEGKGSGSKEEAKGRASPGK